MTPRHLAVLLLPLALLTPSLASPVASELGQADAGPERQDASKVLRSISRELARAEARERPWAALLRGDFALARTVLAEPPPDGAAWIDTLRDLQTRLRRVERVSLSPEERARADSMRGWIVALRTLAEAQATRRSDPLVVTREIERVLLLLLGTDALPLEERIRLGEVYVAQLPARLEAARESLTTPVRSWSIRAAAELVVVERILAEDIHQALTSERLGERALARMQDRLARARTATAEFRAWLLREPARTGRPPQALGERALEVVVGALTGHERGIRELRAELLDVVARDDRGRLTPEEARPTLAETAATVTSALERGAAAGAQLFATGGFEGYGAPPRLRAGTLPGGATPSEFLRLVPSVEGVYVLAFERPDPSWSTSLLRGLAGLASPLTLQAEGLRRGPTGEALLQAAFAARPEDDRMPFLLLPFVEGFGLYSIDVATRLSLPADSPTTEAFARGGARLRLLEAARLLASIETHAQGFSDSEVVDGFRLRTGVSIEVARVETERVWHEPLRGAAILGYLELRRLEDRLARELPRAEAAERALALALLAPGVRPVDLLDAFGPQRR